MAAAMGCSIRWASEAPARLAASFTARRSTSVMADGTQMTTRGRLKRLTPDPLQQQPDHALGDVEVGDGALAQRAARPRCSSGVRPIICQASWPMASTSWVRLLRAMTDGSFSTMPSPAA